jgi:hypothetical protein
MMVVENRCVSMPRRARPDRQLDAARPVGQAAAGFASCSAAVGGDGGMDPRVWPVVITACSSERGERGRDHPERSTLPGLAGTGQLPEDDRAGSDFDQRVDAEPRQRNGTLAGLAMSAVLCQPAFAALATAVTDRWGATHYGRLNGLLSAPSTLRGRPRTMGRCRATTSMTSSWNRSSNSLRRSGCSTLGRLHASGTQSPSACTFMVIYIDCNPVPTYGIQVPSRTSPAITATLALRRLQNAG